MSVPAYRLSRREFVVGAAALSAAAALPAPAIATSAVTVGDFEVMTFYDGQVSLPPSFPAPNVDPEKLKKVLAPTGYTGEAYVNPLNITLVKTPDELILIDAGSGPRFVPTAGRLELALQEAGVDPTDISKVILTHGHPDHLWGTVNDFDELTFPEATYYVAEKEFSFWRDPEVMKNLPEDRQSFAIGAKARFEAIEDRMELVSADDEVISGVGILETNGHTQGHISVELKKGSESLVVLGDAITDSIISFEYPEWQYGGDHLPDVAVATRKRLLDKLSASKAKIIGYHLPSPGIGLVARNGNGFVYEPLA